MAIDKGMPIERVRTGHQRIDTTLQYAMRLKQNNVKIAHRKFIG